MSKTIYISPSGNDTNNGLTEGTAKLTLTSANTVAADGDTIMFLDGTHTYTTEQTVDKNVNITSKNGSVNTIVSSNQNIGITYTGSNSTISNITFRGTESSNGTILALGLAPSSSDIITTWSKNVIITGCVFQIGKYGIALRAENIDISNNDFNLNTSVSPSSITPFLMYFLRGYINFKNNRFNSTRRFSNIIYITGAGTSGNRYAGYNLSCDCSLNIINNDISGSYPAANTNFINRDVLNQPIIAPVGGSLLQSDIDLNTAMTSYKLDVLMENNIVNINHTTTPVNRIKPFVQYSANKLNDMLTQTGTVTIKNNTFGGNSLKDQGIVVLDSANVSQTITSDNYDSPKFYIYDNTVSPTFSIRTGYTGIVEMTHYALTPTDLHERPWLIKTPPAPPTPPPAPTANQLLINGTNAQVSSSGSTTTIDSNVEIPINQVREVVVPAAGSSHTLDVSGQPSIIVKNVAGASGEFTATQTSNQIATFTFAPATGIVAYQDLQTGRVRVAFDTAKPATVSLLNDAVGYIYDQNGRKVTPDGVQLTLNKQGTLDIAIPGARVVLA